MAVACSLVISIFITSKDFGIFYSATSADWSQMYTPAMRNWYYAPWAAVLLWPLGLLPYRIAEFLFRAFAVFVWLEVVNEYYAGAKATAAIFLSPFVLNGIIAAQWEAVLVAGMLLAIRREHCRWSALVAVLLLLTKPAHSLLLVAALLPRLRWRQIATLVAIGLACCLFAGLDWPVRWAQHLMVYKPGLGFPLPLVARALVVAALSTQFLAGDIRTRYAAMLGAGVMVPSVMGLHHMALVAPLGAGIGWPVLVVNAVMMALFSTGRLDVFMWLAAAYMPLCATFISVGMLARNNFTTIIKYSVLASSTLFWRDSNV